MLSFLADKNLFYLRTRFFHKKRRRVRTLFVIEQTVAGSENCTQGRDPWNHEDRGSSPGGLLSCFNNPLTRFSYNLG
jgi:hypothetical protein